MEEEWLEYDDDPQGEYVYYKGGTLTFGESPLTLAPNIGYAGSYVVGVVVEDLNGDNTYEQFAEITLR